MAHLRYIYVSKSIILCLRIIFVQITVTLMSSGSIQNPSYSPQHLQWECLMQASQLPMFNMQRIKSGQAMLWYYICNTFLSFFWVNGCFGEGSLVYNLSAVHRNLLCHIVLSMLGFILIFFYHCTCLYPLVIIGSLLLDLRFLELLPQNCMMLQCWFL